jgi:hypothetical protein
VRRVRCEILWDCCGREVVVRRPVVRGEAETEMLGRVCGFVCVADWQTGRLAVGL